MNELNELIESMLIDVGEEGIGATAGIALLWGMFFYGGEALFARLLEILAGTV